MDSILQQFTRACFAVKMTNNDDNFILFVIEESILMKNSLSVNKILGTVG